MSQEILKRFARVSSQIIGELDIVAGGAEPWPWFCKDIFRKKDLQWGGYFGPISEQNDALVFGLNMEFTGAWRRAYPKINNNVHEFSNLLQALTNFEWHWWGRPGFIQRNPKIRELSVPTWANKVSVAKWLGELDDILKKRMMWSANSLMRPQVQIMRFIGMPEQLEDDDLIKQKIQQTTVDLKPIVDFLLY